MCKCSQYLCPWHIAGASLICREQREHGSVGGPPGGDVARKLAGCTLGSQFAKTLKPERCRVTQSRPWVATLSGGFRPALSEPWGPPGAALLSNRCGRSFPESTGPRAGRHCAPSCGASTPRGGASTEPTAHSRAVFLLGAGTPRGTLSFSSMPISVLTLYRIISSHLHRELVSRVPFSLHVPGTQAEVPRAQAPWPRSPAAFDRRGSGEGDAEGCRPISGQPQRTSRGGHAGTSPHHAVGGLVGPSPGLSGPSPVLLRAFPRSPEVCRQDKP